MSTAALAYVETLALILSESEHAVARAIAILAREEDDITIAKVATIGTQAGRQRRCTQYCLRALEDMGLVTREHLQWGRIEAQTIYSFPFLQKQRGGIDTQHMVHSFTDALKRRALATRKRNRASQEYDYAAKDIVLYATLVETALQSAL